MLLEISPGLRISSSFLLYVAIVVIYVDSVYCRPIVFKDSDGIYWTSGPAMLLVEQQKQEINLDRK